MLQFRRFVLALSVAGAVLAIYLLFSAGSVSAHTGIDGGDHHALTAQSVGEICSTDGRCSHGPDPAPPGVDPSTPDLPEYFSESGFAICDGNGTSGKRVQVLYVRASDQPDRFDQYVASFRGWASEGDFIYQQSARVTGGERYIRFVHDADCRISVTKVTITPAGDADFWSMTAELRNQGYTNPARKYLVFLDSNHPNFCGQADVFHDDSPGAGNTNNQTYGFAVIYNGCWNSQVTIAHELGHNFGAVQRTSPNASRWDHCIDEWDVMCYDDGSGAGYELEFPCEDEASNELLDCNNDDYFSTDPPSGSWLSEHWNVANSGWLGASDATLILSVEQSSYNGTVSAELRGFTPNTVVTVRWSDLTVLDQVTVNGQGSGTATFQVPLVPYETYTVQARDTSGMSATDLLRVASRMTLSDYATYPGETVRVTLYGYKADQQVEIRWRYLNSNNYEVIAIVPIAANGRGTQLITIPFSVEVGRHTIVAEAPESWRQSASTSFTLEQTPWTITLSKESSKYNGVVDVALAGFAPNSAVSVRWADQRVLANPTTNSSGAVNTSFNTPLAPLGNYIVIATDGSGQTAVAQLRIIPRAMLSEAVAYPGDVVRVYYYGYAPGDRVETWWYLDGSNYVVLNTLTIAENGRGSALITIPFDADAGSHTVRGSVVGVSRSTTASLNVLDPPWTVTLDKEKSKYNGVVNASLAGFSASVSVTLTWPDGSVLAQVTTNGSGAATVTFRTPLAPLGDYVVRASSASGQIAITELRVIPRIMLNEESGDAGSRIRVYFYGFAPGDQVEVRFYSSDTAFDVLAVVAIAENGRGTQLIDIPEDADPGDHSISGKVIGVSRSASTTYEVTGSSSADDPTETPTATPTPTATGTPTASPEPTETVQPRPDPTGTP